MTVVRPTALTPGPTNTASASVIGAVRLSIDPADPAAPVAVGDNDPRMTDARPPTMHAATHAADGTDPLTAAAIGAHTLMPKVSAGVQDGAKSALIVAPTLDDENAITVKQPSRTWGQGTYYGTGQAFELLKDTALPTDIGYTAPVGGDGVLGPDDDLVAFRITPDGALGTGGNFHLATGLRQPAGYGSGSGIAWSMMIQPSIDAEHVRMQHTVPGAVNDYLHGFDSNAVQKFRVTAGGNLIAGMNGLVPGKGMLVGDLGAGGANYFGVAHVDAATSVKYGLSQGPNGDTLVNAATGQTLTLRNNNQARVTVGANTGIVPATAATVPLIVQGLASQSADGFQVQNSGGSPVFKVGPAGTVTIGTGGQAFITDNAAATPQAARFRTMGLGAVGPQSPSPIFVAAAINVSDVPMVSKGALGHTANLQEWQDSTGAAKASVDASGVASVGSLIANNIVRAKNIQDPSGSNTIVLDSTTPTTGRVKVNAASVGDVVLAAKGALGQTGDLIQGQDSTGASKFSVNSAGGLTISGGINSFGGHVFTNNGASVIQATSSAVGTVTAILKQAVSQTASVQEWQNSAGAPLMKARSDGGLELVAATGTFTGTRPTGGALGDKIALYGDGTVGGQFGIGIQPSRVVSFGGGFSARTPATTGASSSGTPYFDADTSRVFVANTAAAPAAPTGGGAIYVEAGALKYRGTSGTITTIAPA